MFRPAVFMLAAALVICPGSAAAADEPQLQPVPTFELAERAGASVALSVLGFVGCLTVSPVFQAFTSKTTNLVLSVGCVLVAPPILSSAVLSSISEGERGRWSVPAVVPLSLGVRVAAFAAVLAAPLASGSHNTEVFIVPAVLASLGAGGLLEATLLSGDRAVTLAPTTPFRVWATIGALGAIGGPSVGLPGPVVAGGSDAMLTAGGTGVGLQIEAATPELLSGRFDPLVSASGRFRGGFQPGPLHGTLVGALSAGLGFTAGCRGDVCGSMGLIGGAALAYHVPVDEHVSVIVRTSAEFMLGTFGVALILPSLTTGIEL